MWSHSLAVGNGERDEAVADNCGGWAWHSGEKRAVAVNRVRRAIHRKRGGGS